jgi:hypothetical protein
MIYELNHVRIEGAFLIIEAPDRFYALRISSITSVTKRYYPSDTTWDLTLRADGKRYSFTFHEPPNGVIERLLQ